MKHGVCMNSVLVEAYWFKHRVSLVFNCLIELDSLEILNGCTFRGTKESAD